MDTATPTATPPPKPAPKPVRSKRRWYIIAGVVMLLLALPMSYWFVAGYMRDRQLERIYAELDAEDPNWRWPDLIASMPPAPDDENAFLQIGKVHGMLKKTPFALPPTWYNGSKEAALNMHRARLSEENAGILRASFAALNLKIVPEARKLKDLPKGRLKIDPTINPFELMLDDVQRARELMNLLQSDVMLRLHDNDVEGAVESWHALLNTSHAIEDNPTLIGQLVRIAGQAIALNALERLLNQGELSEADLAKIHALLEREVADNLLFHGMRGERAGSHQMYLNMRDGKTTFSKMMAPINKGGATGIDHVADLFPSILLRGYPEHLRLFNEQVAASKLSDVERMEAMQKVEQKVRTNPNLLTRMIMPASNKVAEACQRSQAMLRCAMVAVAIERYRLKNEAWPRGFDDLLQENLLQAIPKDPYDGKLLRFKRTPASVVIYSVGFDKVDNQGKLDRNYRTPDTDMGIELWEPRLRGISAPAEEEKQPLIP